MKKFTVDLQRFDEPITDFDGLKAAITAAANNAELTVTLADDADIALTEDLDQ